MKQYLLFLIFTAVLGMVGCSKDAAEPQIDVEKDFILEMRENLSPGGNTLQFLAETTADQECLDTGIAVDLQKNTTAINLSFLEIIEPADCLPGNEKARDTIQAGDLAIRDYTFKIDLRGELESIGVLNVLEDRYVVSFSRQIGFDFVENIMLRVRPNMLWGYVNHDESQANEVREFVLALNDITEEIEPETGNYGWFRVAEFGVSEIADMPEERENELILLNYTGEDAALEELLAQYRSEYPEMTFAFFNAKGKSF